MNLKDLILTAPDIETIALEIPEWQAAGQPITVKLRQLSGLERDAWETRSQNDVNAKRYNVRAQAAAASIVDDAGARVFVTDAEIEQLGTKNAKALDRIWAAFLKLNKLSRKDEAEIEKK